MNSKKPLKLEPITSMKHIECQTSENMISV